MEQAHPLSEWLNKTGESQADFARRINVSESHLSLIVGRKRGLSLKLAAKIEEATNRKVPAAKLVLVGASQ
ncbi:helix-turn-helix transcriptional regulator [Mesorhizobium sp. ESP-6-2]|uniref:helix-turn-helix transcriptional regulator n=1 Tax=Mesorhizobium sp. ESP-6-2 TaxID=2876625 RepID=UPI001CCDEC26|nr:helix-turn-helix transcriptional regulator [Mesorhizobium sp. ESP-6-2]MBZ9807664.1 helix-turn-helix transcriptional regulator [Mesorhizobium sp. ESP-6-2]